MTDVSVVVPTHNRVRLLKPLLDSLRNQNYPKKRYEIIVVDDGSTDGTGSFLENLRGIIYLRQENSGPASARNVGIRKARGGIVAFIDDDCVPDKDWIREMWKAFAKNVSAVEGMTISPGDIFADSHHIRNPKGGMYLTCNMAYRAEELQKGFDEKYMYPNREDSDLAFSLLKKGRKIAFSDKMIVRHAVLECSTKKMIVRKKFFESDVLLFKKYPELYRKKIGAPFDRFMPLYFAAFVTGIFYPAAFVAIPAVALAENRFRKYKFRLSSVVKLMVSQTAGSFVNIFAVTRGCIRYRINPLRFI